jgi:Ca2+-dependent lipid-binding protein
VDFDLAVISGDITSTALIHLVRKIIHTALINTLVWPNIIPVVLDKGLAASMLENKPKGKLFLKVEKRTNVP